jgi:regulator of protease activity HflC (stomatin/prohibitin superfamily)
VKIIGAIAAFIILLIILVFAFGSWGTVNAGNRGIVIRMGAVTGEVKGEGVYGKTPWIESVREIAVRVQKTQVETEGASKDLQIVHTIVAINLAIQPEKCAQIYQKFGDDFAGNVIVPSAQESIKAVLAQYTAEELVTKRESVREAIRNLVIEKLTPIGLRIDAVNIVDFDFSKTFNEAIEAKVTAEQHALAAKNKLAQIEFEAQQKIAEAKGKAEAMQLESAAIAKNPQILQLRALEKWDGIMPKVTGGATPFINLSELLHK